MDVVYYLLPLALLLGGGFLASFILAVRDGQFDDLETPPHRMLLDDKSLEPIKSDGKRSES